MRPIDKTTLDHNLSALNQYNRICMSDSSEDQS